MVSIGAAMAYAALGGALAEVPQFAIHRSTAPAEFPAHLKTIRYWLFTLILIAAGVGLVVLYHSSSDVKLNGWLAANVGATAPLLIDKSLKASPPGPPGSVS